MSTGYPLFVDGRDYLKTGVDLGAKSQNNAAIKGHPQTTFYTQGYF